MPTGRHLFRDNTDKKMYTLEVDFMHAYDKSVTEDYTVKVILPEGATDIQLELAGDIKADSIDMGKYFGTMTYFGKPMITIKKTNAIHDICDSTLRVKYRFESQLFSMLTG